MYRLEDSYLSIIFPDVKLPFYQETKTGFETLYAASFPEIVIQCDKHRSHLAGF